MNIDYNYIINDIGVLSEYRGCSNVVTWVEIIYQASTPHPDFPDQKLYYNNKPHTIDVFSEETFDPSNFIDKSEINTSIIRQWTDASIPLSKIVEWENSTESYFTSTIARIMESKNIAVVDAPWIQISPT